MAANQTGYTLTKLADSYMVFGAVVTVVFDVAPTASSYYTTGYKITPANVGLKSIFDVIINTQTPPSGTPLTTMILPMWDDYNTALQLFEVSATGTISGLNWGGTFAGNSAGLTATSTAPTINLAAGGTNAFGTMLFNQGSAVLINGTAGTAFTGINGVQAPTITVASYSPAGTVTGSVTGGSFSGSATTLKELASAADASAYVFRIRFFGLD